MYTAYIWDHHGERWEFDADTNSKWGLRAILRRLRRHYDDISFLIVSGTATEWGYLAAEKDEVRDVDANTSRTKHSSSSVVKDARSMSRNEQSVTARRDGHICLPGISRQGKRIAAMILAIDPSLTNTALVYGDAASYDHWTLGSKNAGDSVAARIARYDDLVVRIMDWICERPVSAVYIEAYSYGSNDARAKFSAEYGGILRWHLVELTERIFEVAPSTLKKFCTGKGAGGKDLVAAHLARRYGVMFPDNDSFDAYGLFRLGLVAEQLVEPDNNAQREAAHKVLGIGKPAKKSRAKKCAGIPLPITPQPAKESVYGSDQNTQQAP